MTANWQLPTGVSRAVWDYVHDEQVAATYDALLANTPLLQADLAFVNRYIPHKSNVIDLGCGTGRAAIPLAQRGHRVVAVDLSQPMLRVARHKRHAGLVRWICGNLADLTALRDNTFDAAVCLFSTLGMVAGVEGRQNAICEAHRLLRPGGVFVLHAHQIGHLLVTHQLRGAWMRDRLKRICRLRGTGDVRMPSSEGLPGWTMHLFTRREITQLLRMAGFCSLRITSIGIDGLPIRWPTRALAYGFLISAEKR